MTATPEASADMAKHRDRSAHLLNNGFCVEPTYTLDRDIARARAEMGENRWNELNADWNG